MKGILKIDLQEKYTCDIHGLGEIYEIISVEFIRCRLKKLYGHGTLYLCSNKIHSGKGFSFNDLADAAKRDGHDVISQGLVDCPPWKSAEITMGISKKMRFPFSVIISKIIFTIWIPLFEHRYSSIQRAHALYLLGGNNDDSV
jgi:hypothetical protein